MRSDAGAGSAAAGVSAEIEERCGTAACKHGMPGDGGSAAGDGAAAGGRGGWL